MRAGLALSLGLAIVGIFGLVATAASPQASRLRSGRTWPRSSRGWSSTRSSRRATSWGGYQMSGIPDGLGAYKDSGNLQVLSNHELGKTFPASPAGVDVRISKYTLNDKTHGVLTATYLFNGSEGFERFCSATLEDINGTPYYFTGEEAINAGHDGSSVVMNARTGTWTETPHFGHIQHENIVPVGRISKFMVVTTDDDFRVGSPSLLLATSPTRSPTRSRATRRTARSTCGRRPTRPTRRRGCQRDRRSPASSYR